MQRVCVAAPHLVSIQLLHRGVHVAQHAQHVPAARVAAPIVMVLLGAVRAVRAVLVCDVHVPCKPRQGEYEQVWLWLRGM